jgi:serine protease AprX
MKKIKALLAVAACASMVLVSVHTGQASSFLPLAKAQDNNNSQVVENSKIHPNLLNLLQTNREGTVNVIVSKKPNAQGVLETAKLLGAKVKSNWDLINTFSAEMKVSLLDELASHQGVVIINEDSSLISTGFDAGNSSDVAAVQNVYNASVKADKAWARGVTGKGVTVAVVDSGISLGASNDFGHRLVGNASKYDNVQDQYGHGTHVAAIIAGDGTASNGKYVGIAPGANILNVKYSNENGVSTEGDLLNALKWIYDNKDIHNIRVVNISSTVGAKSRYTESPTAAAVELLWGAGVVVVTSAGNNGYDDCAICSAPANDPFVITVGAVDDNGTKYLGDDFQKPWSSEGYTMSGVFKPEIMAPGTNIVSYMPTGKNRNVKPENIVDGAYFKMGGTSMAAPVVSGVVALMLEANPDLTPNQIKWIINSTGRDFWEFKEQYLATLSKEQKDNLDIDEVHHSYYRTHNGNYGIINADAAVYYALRYTTESIPSANLNYALSPYITGSNGTTFVDAESNGTWANGTWANGTWANGTWANGTWANGTWANGTWANGTWANGTWANGTWANVYWK